MEKYQESIYPLIKELCAIPAPSHYEDERAKFCKDYFISAGFDKVYIDNAKNVICEYCPENSNELTVFTAHTDTVFPDKEPMPFYEKDGKAFCPGIGDDTASVAVLLTSAKYLIDNNITSKNGILFVCNSCEEGLGNLKGTKVLMEKYKGRIKRFISFDSGIDYMYTSCVGSHRYNVEVETEGGHSFGAFGNENAINKIAGIIKKIYEIEVPKIGDSKTTYNVGTISGGTSVNTIAQNASMLCEYRSDNVECLNIMKEKFDEILKDSKVTMVGERPCAKDVNEEILSQLINECKQVIESVISKEILLKCGSTDCNIPMSMGIPSVAVGVYRGAKCHTREEWIEIDSLNLGFEIALKLIKMYL